ncbi:MAG TPA: serine/threonine-protein kinase [Thermoanaerobaculia bacterium]|nr:serine/threonine-protein kinase [Thermoanaerobaculia bacterium]
MSELAGDPRKNYGPYEVESVLGRGAMGMVYLARDRRIGRKVALKTVHVEERFDDESEANEFYKRLQREAELCGSLQHPNIVTLYEPGYDNDIIAWLATEYIDGESLRDRMKKRKPLPLAEALRIADGILRGLTFAHAKGIIHRDIKPANILLTAAGEAKIADFGIARPVDSNLTAVGEMLGTPSYMSPEQVKCTAVTARSDLFSVGTVLYEMVTGVKAFASNDVSGILRNVVEMDPKPAHAAHAQVPESLSAFIGRLLAKDPEDRYPSAAAALQDLQAIETEVAPEAFEEVGPADAVSTLSAAARRQPGPPTQPSVTSISHLDATPAVGSRGSRGTTQRSFDRPIPASVFIGVIAALLLAFGIAALAIRVQTDSEPTIVFTDEELQLFADKRDSLDAARRLYSAGEYEQALKAYDAYLVRHPASVVAREERSETALALEAKTKSGSTVTVSSKTPSTRKAPTKKAEPPKKGFWRRVFGRD